MEQKGILAYGYGDKELNDIKKEMEGIVDCEVVVIDGTGHEHDTVRDILEGRPSGEYAALPTKFVMFLGFEDAEIRDALAAFSVEPRPIFCCLTKMNYTWELSYLANHLEEEKEAMARGAETG